jgi:hypothetical protein
VTIKSLLECCGGISWQFITAYSVASGVRRVVISEERMNVYNVLLDRHFRDLSLDTFLLMISMLLVHS